jgi:hypothetical protein
MLRIMKIPEAREEKPAVRHSGVPIETAARTVFAFRRVC